MEPQRTGYHINTNGGAPRPGQQYGTPMSNSAGIGGQVRPMQNAQAPMRPVQRPHLTTPAHPSAGSYALAGSSNTSQNPNPAQPQGLLNKTTVPPSKRPSNAPARVPEVRTDPRAVVSKLLFVHGDVEDPNPDTVDYVLDMAYDFMVQVMSPAPIPRPTPPNYDTPTQAQPPSTSTLRHRLRSPHHRKKLAVLQEAIIKQKLAADKAKKSAAADRKTKKKTGDGEMEVDVDELAAGLDLPGFGGFGGLI